MGYAEALEQVRSAVGAPLARGSAAESEAIARFKGFFASFAPDRIARLLETTYAENAYFNDTLKEIRGRAALRPYLEHAAAAVEHCTVEVHDVVANDTGDYYFRWTMVIRFKRFRRGIDTRSIGVSHIRFDADGRVVLHQDYWNAADGLFEHIPVLGALIRFIKRRL